MDVKYTIIIPHYNSVASLGILLASIPTKPEIQIVVVDDNSTQELDLLEKVINEDDRCELYKNTTGVQSAGASRNVGLEYARGKWVLFADSDDYFIDGLYENLEYYYDNPSDVIFFTPTSINTSTLKKSSRHYLYAGLIKNYINKPNRKNEIDLKYRFGVSWSKMIRRDLITQNHIKFDCVLIGEDNIFSTNVSINMKSFQVTERTIYCVTKSDNTLMSTMNESKFENMVDVLIMRYGLLRKVLSKSELRKLGLAGDYLLVEAFINFGIKKVLKTMFKLYKNNVKLFAVSCFNLTVAIEILKDRRK